VINQGHYQAPSWLLGAHLQTVVPALWVPRPKPVYRRERLELPDGDFTDIDFVDPPTSRVKGAKVKPEPNAMVVLFHGLEGSSTSHYARALMQAVSNQGMTGAVVHWRGCSGQTNRLARSYHSGESGDIDFALNHLKIQLNKQSDQTTEQTKQLFAVGVSLGGNALIKWLGEPNRNTQIIDAAAAISAPHDLEAGAIQLRQGFSKMYTRNFLSTLVKKGIEKINQHPVPFTPAQLYACRDFHDFDEIVTAPLHGFSGAKDYWTRCSSKQFMSTIQRPTLIINAINDPFLPQASLAKPNEVSKHVQLEYPNMGGHVGFAQGGFPGNLDWLPNRCLSFFNEQRRA
jgi:uncharacterized protein